MLPAVEHHVFGFGALIVAEWQCQIVALHACVVDLSELGSSAARRRFMVAFAEALYETNTEPLHLVLDEADLWAPQRPQPEAQLLLGRIEEIVRRGRVRGFIPWLITQRPAVIHKDVLSQADILIAMKLTASQDRDAIGGWIEGQADRTEGKRILGELPRLGRGEGFLWAPGHELLARVTFPAIGTFDSSRTPRRGEQVGTPRTLAEVDLSAIVAALADTDTAGGVGGDVRTSVQVNALYRQLADRDKRLAEAHARAAGLESRLSGTEQELTALRDVLGRIGRLANEQAPASVTPSREHHAASSLPLAGETTKVSGTRLRQATAQPVSSATDASLHPAARKLLVALAQHAPARFTWGQAATLAGLKPSGGHYNAGRKQLRDRSLIDEIQDLVTASSSGIEAAGVVPPAPSSSAERLALWCERLPSPAPEMLRALAAHGERHTEIAALAAALSKKPTGGHWNSGIALLRNNGLVEIDGKRLRVSELFR